MAHPMNAKRAAANRENETDASRTPFSPTGCPPMILAKVTATTALVRIAA